MTPYTTYSVIRPLGARRHRNITTLVSCDVVSFWIYLQTVVSFYTSCSFLTIFLFTFTIDCQPGVVFVLYLLFWFIHSLYQARVCFLAASIHSPFEFSTCLFELCSSLHHTKRPLSKRRSTKSSNLQPGLVGFPTHIVILGQA